MIDGKVLLLNSSREFLSVVSWQDAIGDVVVGNVRVLREYDRVIRSQHLEMKVPAVIQEIKYVHVKWNHIFRITHSAKNVFIRDNYECQYCGYMCSRFKYSQTELAKKPKLYLIKPEMEHVIPSSKGGLNTWENTVTACRRCNNRKDNRSLADVGMKLRRLPVKPDSFKEIFEMKVGQIHDLWYDFLSIYF